MEVSARSVIWWAVLIVVILAPVPLVILLATTTKRMISASTVIPIWTCSSTIRIYVSPLRTSLAAGISVVLKCVLNVRKNRASIWREMPAKNVMLPKIDPSVEGSASNVI